MNSSLLRSKTLLYLNFYRHHSAPKSFTRNKHLKIVNLQNLSFLNYCTILQLTYNSILKILYACTILATHEVIILRGNERTRDGR